MKSEDMSPGRRQDWEALIAAYSQGNPATTVERAQRYLKVNSEDGAGWLIFGGTLCQLARYNEAIGALRKAIRLLPPGRRDAAYSEMGHLYREKGSLRAAERWYRKAIEVNSKTTNLVFLGALLAKQGRYAEAKRYYRRAIELRTEDIDEAYYNLGLVLRAEGDYRGALYYFDKALDLDPNYTAAKQSRNDVVEALGVQTRSKETYTRQEAQRHAKP